jgi:hypothetical protein
MLQGAGPLVAPEAEDTGADDDADEGDEDAWGLTGR